MNKVVYSPRLIHEWDFPQDCTVRRTILTAEQVKERFGETEVLVEAPNILTFEDCRNRLGLVRSRQARRSEVEILDVGDRVICRCEHTPYPHVVWELVAIHR